MKSLGNIKHINIDCYVSTTSNPDDVLELHGFCDASEVAYCATIYIPVISNSSVITSLLAAKCQLVPMKGHSIPSLELLACYYLPIWILLLNVSQSKSKYAEFIAGLTLKFLYGG